MKRIIISRWTFEEVPMEHWKELISALVMVGYSVYGDDDRIVFTLGDDDIVKEIE